MSSCTKLVCPQFLAGLGIESAKALIIGRANEHYPASRNDAATEVWPSGVLLALGKRVRYTKIDPPGNLAGIYVDGK